MPPPSDRRFSLFDAMVLIAATAVGMASIRSLGADALEMYGGLDAESESTLPTRLERAVIWVLVTWPCVAAWTLAVLALRLRRPRPPRRRLFRQPGAVACASAATVFLLFVLMAPAWALIVGRAFWDSSAEWVILMYDGPAYVGAAVGASWATQALGGRWRPDPGWLDRAGRLLGLLWLALAPVSLWFQTVR